MDELINNKKSNSNSGENLSNRAPLEIKPESGMAQTEKIPSQIDFHGYNKKEVLDIESKNPIEIIKEEVLEEIVTPNQNNDILEEKETLPKETIADKVGVLEKISKPTEAKKETTILNSIRTYKGDVVSTLKNQKTSVSDIVLAKKKKYGYGEVAEEKKPINPKVFIFISIFIVLLVGGFGVYSIVTKEDTTIIEVKRQQVSPIIFPNYQREVILDNLKEKTIKEAIFLEQENIFVPLTSVVQIFFTKPDPTGEFVIDNVGENKILITTDSFLEALGVRTPSSLLRSISANFMFGYHSSLGNNPFLIFEVRSYDSVFAGMLDWEKTMFKELYSVFKRETSSIGEESNIFQDIIIANKDVRAILGNDGKIEFAYSFPDKETLVIVNNETTLREIYKRLNISKMEREN